jgi:hypothetical protein
MEEVMKRVWIILVAVFAIVAGLMAWLMAMLVKRLGPENVLLAISSFGPLIVSTLVAYIAFSQYRIGRAQLRANIFDRRLAAYDELVRIADQIGRAKTCSYATLQAARLLSNRAEFLFEGHARAAFHDLVHLCIQLVDPATVPDDDKWITNPIAESDIKGVVGKIIDPYVFAPFLKLRG